MGTWRQTQEGKAGNEESEKEPHLRYITVPHTHTPPLSEAKVKIKPKQEVW